MLSQRLFGFPVYAQAKPHSETSVYLISEFMSSDVLLVTERT